MATERYMVMDVALCHDCNNCFMACTDEHADNDWAPYQAPMPWHGHRWMDILRHERGENDRIDVAFLAKPCFQCGDGAPCAKAAGGAVKTRGDGIVEIYLDAAKGKDLTKDCPYGSIWWNEEAQLPQKCDFCAHLLDNPSWEHGVPRCVHSCPTGALKFYTEEPAAFAKRVEAEGLSAYKPMDGTTPHVWYKNLHRFTKNFVTGGVLRGYDWAEGVEVTLEGAGVKQTQKTTAFGEYKFDGLEDGDYTLTAEGKTLATVSLKGASVDAGDAAL